MTLFVIDAVQFNAGNERVEKVRWGKIRGGEVSSPVWVTAPSVTEVAAVVDAIKGGDEVMTLFATASGAVVGPKVHVVTYDDRSQGIEADKNDIAERSLRDLPGF